MPPAGDCWAIPELPEEQGMDGRMKGWMEGRKEGWMDEGMNGRKEGWMEGRRDGWMSGWSLGGHS